MTDELTERARQLSAEAAHLYEVTRHRKEAVRVAERQALDAGGEATSPDGAVRVTVDAGGMLTGLVLTAKALRRQPGDLAGLITEVTQQAAASARAAVRQVYEPLREEGILREMPLLLPSPPVPARPRKDYEEEASFEERWVTRRSDGR